MANDPAHRPVTVSDQAPVSSVEQARACFAVWQQRASERGIVLRPPPPEPTTCCGRGCNGCVWEGWYAAVAYWCEEAEQRVQD